MHILKLILKFVLPSFLLLPLAAFKAMGQEKQTFSPLPPGARVISEKNGERIAEWNGITLVDTSKEKQSQQPVPTVEEAIRVRRNAKPKKVRPPTHDQGREVDSPSQPQLDPTRLVPGRNLKKNSQTLLDSPDLGLKKIAHPLTTSKVPKTPEQIIASVSSLTPLEVSLSVKNLKLARSFPGAIPHSQPYQFPFTREEVIDDYAATYPYFTVGTLSFTDPRDGLTYVCTASIVDTPNGNTIFTAGHCIGENNVLFTNITFVPANYLDRAPFGVWTACGRYPTTSWLRNSDYTNDIGAIKVCPRSSDGASLENVLGGTLGFAWGQGRNWNWTMVGYPAEAPFTYPKQYFCQSSHGKDDPASNLSANPPLAIGCDLLGGASGSPFILDFARGKSGASYINGVYSYDYSGVAERVMKLC